MDLSSCGMLETQELSQLCSFLSAEIRGLRLLPWITGLVGIFGAILASILTNRSAHKLQKTERFNRAQRDALISMQEVAQDLRRSWLAHYNYIQKSGKGRRNWFFNSMRQSEVDTGDPFPDTEQTALIGKYDTALGRIDDKQVRDDYSAWSKYAEELFSGSGVVQSYIEEEMWKQTLKCSGEALRALDK